MPQLGDLWLKKHKPVPDFHNKSWTIQKDQHAYVLYHIADFIHWKPAFCSHKMVLHNARRPYCKIVCLFAKPVVDDLNQDMLSKYVQKSKSSALIQQLLTELK